MSKYSEQDLKYAAEFREELHREALSIVRKTRPNADKVIDRHPVEDYFQQSWEYPGQWYTVVAIPHGYSSRKAFVDSLVRDTLSESVAESDSSAPQKEPDSAQISPTPTVIKDDPFYLLLADYPDLAVEYCIVNNENYCGYESHRKALSSAFREFGKGRKGNPAKAEGKIITVAEMLSSQYQSDKLNYRKAFLYPPHKTNCDGKDFARVNSALFPNGTDKLEVYEWDTNWSDYFDDGHEWWGALCLTVYDKTLDRFVVITASATD